MNKKATQQAVIDFAQKMHIMGINWHPDDKLSDYGGNVHIDVLRELELEWESLFIECDKYDVDVYEAIVNWKKNQSYYEQESNTTSSS